MACSQAHVCPRTCCRRGLAARVCQGSQERRSDHGADLQSSGEELEVFSRIGHPYFRPVWRPGIVGMVLDGDTDWTEVAELVTESYCLLAPDKLVALVNRPPA